MDITEIVAGQTLNFGSIMVDVLHQEHGNISSLGFVFNGKFGYSTDVIDMPDKSFAKLKDLDLWIVEALRPEPHSSHSNYEQTFGWIEAMKPKHAVLTHLGLEADYSTLASLCPPNVEPGVDGLSFTLD
jgi:phosphoribosyl 1,2-cyclic phosphate phosphodiesterase